MERDHLKDLRIDGIILLKGTFKEWDGEMWTGIIWLRIIHTNVNAISLY